MKWKCRGEYLDRGSDPLVIQIIANNQQIFSLHEWWHVRFKIIILVKREVGNIMPDRGRRAKAHGKPLPSVVGNVQKPVRMLSHKLPGRFQLITERSVVKNVPRDRVQHEIKIE